ncbi:hypothetical protein [Streptomyces sp. MS2.AVA.5]|uniref:Uncharacterized protein n=1 Tax=Streptomyces achmelvichensis TaxID=3134111 RepID=A0ACC6Q901_9ACTN
MSGPSPKAQFRFLLSAVLEAAEHAAAAPRHHLFDDEAAEAPALWWITDDGSYLMSNGAYPEGTPKKAPAWTLVFAQGWDRGTHPGSVLGDECAEEAFPLCDPNATDAEPALLDMLRKSVRDGHVWLVLEVTSDDDLTLCTLPDRPIITSNTVLPTGLEIPMDVTATGDHVYPAMVDVTSRWNGFLSPSFTLATVRQLAADTQTMADEYGYGDMDTVHVIDGGTNAEGQPRAVVIHVRWQYLGEGSDTAANIVKPNASGRYPIGGWEWTWQAVEPREQPTAPPTSDSPQD